VIGLLKAAPLKELNPESFRLPGLLICPDGFAAGQVCASLFAHEDTLDLLYLMAGPAEPLGARKFLDWHRMAVSTWARGRLSVITGDAYWCAPRDQGYTFQGRWGLTPGVSPAAQRRIDEVRTAMARYVELMWVPP
jgi:hypothetical protein